MLHWGSPLRDQTSLLHDKELDVNPFVMEPADLDIEDANQPFNLLDEDEDEDNNNNNLYLKRIKLGQLAQKLLSVKVLLMMILYLLFDYSICV